MHLIDFMSGSNPRVDIIGLAIEPFEIRQVEATAHVQALIVWKLKSQRIGLVNPVYGYMT